MDSVRGTAKGNYGAFLQEEPELIRTLIRTLADGLDVPVTAKIRILDTPEASLAYAQMVVDAGATVLCVHGRTREQKGHNTGLADWSVLRYIRERLPHDVVMFANGNVLWHEDVDACIAATGVDGVMSAEGNLHNPAIFSTSRVWDERFPRMDDVAREYLDIIRTQILPHLPLAELLRHPPRERSKKKLNAVFGDANLTPIKSHLFKLWHTLVARHLDVRNMVGRASTRNIGEDGNPLREYEECLQRVTTIIEAELAEHPEALDEDGKWVGPDTEVAEDEDLAGREGIEVRRDGKRFLRNVPWYRCQPHYRPLPEEARANGALKDKVVKERKSEAEEEDATGRAAKKAKVEEAAGGSGDEAPKFADGCC